MDIQQTYAGSYFYYSNCYPETGVFNRYYVEEQIANGFGYSKYKYADIKVCVDKQRANNDDQLLYYYHRRSNEIISYQGCWRFNDRCLSKSLIIISAITDGSQA